MTKIDVFNESSERALLALRIAKSLMNFPLKPKPHEDEKQFYGFLEVSFTYKILELLNEEHMKSEMRTSL